MLRLIYYPFNALVTLFENFGRFVLLLSKVFKKIDNKNLFLNNSLQQMVLLGSKSIPIVILTSFFTGLVGSVQAAYQMESSLVPAWYIGSLVGETVLLELAPVITCLVLAGRVGATITAEIGAMRVTEQIDALEALSHDPVKYLVIPRVLAASIMLPLLVGIADIIGFLSGLLVAKVLVNMNHFAYFNSAQLMLGPFDIVGGLIKAVVFGFVISLISCYRGLNSGAGAKGVGETTTRAVVQSLMTVFVLNYFLTILLF